MVGGHTQHDGGHADSAPEGVDGHVNGARCPHGLASQELEFCHPRVILPTRPGPAQDRGAPPEFHRLPQSHCSPKALWVAHHAPARQAFLRAPPSHQGTQGGNGATGFGAFEKRVGGCAVRGSAPPRSWRAFHSAGAQGGCRRGSDHPRRFRNFSRTQHGETREILPWPWHGPCAGEIPACPGEAGEAGHRQAPLITRGR